METFDAAAVASAIEGRVVTDADVAEAWARDQSLLTSASTPLAVVRAGAVGDVPVVLREATRTRTPVVVRGAGTGLAGGANGRSDAVTLDLSGLDRILDLDPATRLARVQPGVLNADLDRAAAEHGLTYAPDPGSRAISTIGGNIATDAGGMCCVRYGVTGDHVAALTAVLADGREVRTGSPTRKDVAGLDLTRLLVGSEGTLAVITEATVRLRPRARRTSTVVAVFATARAAVDAVVTLMATCTPAACELMDGVTVGAVEDRLRMGLDRQAGALLLLRFDDDDVSADAAERACVGATEVHRTDDPDEGDALMAARREALPAMEGLGPILLDDVAVPVPRLPDLLDAIDAAATRHGVLVGTFGHAGDGNLHPCLVVHRGTAGGEGAARSAFDDIVRATLDLGGTIAGEHGVGSLKLDWLAHQRGPVERELMHGIRQVFDPLGLLNPGRGS